MDLAYKLRSSDLKRCLNNYITASPPHLPQCARNLAVASSVCKRLGLPLHPDKTEGRVRFQSSNRVPTDSEAGSPKAATIRIAAEEMVHTYVA